MTGFKIYATYVAALASGCCAPALVLGAARSAAVGSSPLTVVVSVILCLGLVSGALAAFVPQRWLSVAAVVSAPIGLVGIAMFAALAQTGDFYFVWLWAAIGSMALSLFVAFVSAKSVLRKAAPANPGGETEEK
jgi:hypothetical protein